MATPRGLLAPGEAVVLDLHPHGRALVRPLTLVPVTIGFAAFVAAATPAWAVAGTPLQGWLRLAIAVLAVVVLLRWSLAPYLRWRGRRYLVTTSRILVRDGVLRRSGRDIPLARVEDVSYAAGIVDRLCGSGTLVLASGGEHGRVWLTAVPRVREVQRTVEELVARAPRADPWAPAPV